VVTEASGEFVKADTLVIVRVQATKNRSDTFWISSFKGRKRCKLICVETSIFTSDFGKLFLSVSLQGCSPSVPGTFPLLIGELAVSIGVKFCDMSGTALRTGGPARLLGSLALFFVNDSIFVEIELREHFWQFAVTEGAVSVGIGKAEAEGKTGKSEVV